MVFSKRIAPGHDIFCTIWKGGIFFPENMVFFPWTENERGVIFLKKYTETLYFLIDMPPCKKKKKSKTILSCKNTPKGHWHSRSTPQEELQQLPVPSWRPLKAFSYIALQQKRGNVTYRIEVQLLLQFIWLEIFYNE